MRKPLTSENFLQGYGITGGIVFVVLVFLVVRVLTWPDSSQTVMLTDLSKAHKVYARAPVFPFRTGDLHIFYEGELSTNATLEVVANGDNKTVIPLQAGEVSGSYGGSEDWGSSAPGLSSGVSARRDKPSSGEFFGLVFSNGKW